MSAQIIDGKVVAAQVTAGVKARVEALKAKGVTVGAKSAAKNVVGLAFIIL